MLTDVEIYRDCLRLVTDLPGSDWRQPQQIEADATKVYDLVIKYMEHAYKDAIS